MVIAATASDSRDEALLSGLGDEDRRSVSAAREYAEEAYANRALGTGEPVLEHALGMADSAARLKLDASARMAAFLFAVPDFDKDAQRKLEARFGAPAASLVAGISRLNELRGVAHASVQSGRQNPAQLEALRKMLLAMVEDIRVVLLRLASRVQTLRYFARAGEALAGPRRAVAQETLGLYAPLANRLGIWQLKWELEDLSFRFIEPELYRNIARMLEERRLEREGFIAAAIAELGEALAAAGIRADITGRPKHIYSIYTKMRSKNLAFSEIHDVRALRVLVEDVRECYAVLGIVHALWNPIAEDFDDYIARPKENLYRSLHTAVEGMDGRPLEVQIRTHEMHRIAELGVAAHWRYKEGEGRAGESYDRKIAALRQMLAWRDEVMVGFDWVDATQRAELGRTIYALTPENRVIDLPSGATPVDFAYAVHTGLGHRCRGAKVNGAIVPLDRRLENGDRVEIIAARAQESGPSRDWLNPALGYIASSRARHKVRQWFNARELAATTAAGRAALERELQREGRTGASHAELASTLGFDSPEALYAAVGRDDVGPRQLQLAITGKAAGRPEAPSLEAPRPAARERGGILVVGVDRLLTQLARCCKPVPPDRITGFVTRGRGVSIHRSECASLARLRERHPERLLEAQWGNPPADRLGSGKAPAFAVDVAVQARERIDLLRDISEVLAREHVRVSGLQTHGRDGAATLFLTLEVSSLEHLKRTLPLLEAVRGVSSARRR
jgi:GTP pyrophosphokinase